MKSLYFLLVIALTALVAFGCQRESSPAFQQGRQIYQNYCVTCHGVEGRGVLYPETVLYKNALVAGAPEEVIKIILDGREGPGIMPGWRTTLNDEEIAAVATFIRQAWANRATAIPPGMVAEVRGNGKK